MTVNPGEVIVLDGANIKGVNIISKLDALVREGAEIAVVAQRACGVGGPKGAAG